MKSLAMAFACLSVLSLGGCAIFDDPVNKIPEITASDFTPAQESAVKAGVLRLLSYPSDSAFTELSGGRAGDVFYVCGKVKSRASFGVVTPFMVKLTGSTVEPVSMGGAEYQNQIAIALCHQYGIN